VNIATRLGADEKVQGAPEGTREGDCIKSGRYAAMKPPLSGEVLGFLLSWAARSLDHDGNRTRRRMSASGWSASSRSSRRASYCGSRSRTGNAERAIALR
jgi:hypothetical protein